MEKSKGKNEGLKDKGYKNPEWDKLEKQGNKSEKFAPFHDQGKGKGKVKHDHKIPGKDM
jgi:hypothetical protein